MWKTKKTYKTLANPCASLVFLGFSWLFLGFLGPRSPWISTGHFLDETKSNGKGGGEIWRSCTPPFYLEVPLDQSCVCAVGGGGGQGGWYTKNTQTSPGLVPISLTPLCWKPILEQIFGQGFDQGFWVGETPYKVYSTTSVKENTVKTFNTYKNI